LMDVVGHAITIAVDLFKIETGDTSAILGPECASNVSEQAGGWATEDG